MTQRALMIRDDADAYWLACQMQHSRITNPGPDVISDPRSSLVRRRIDVDFFVVSLHRLHTVAKLAAEVADPRNILPAAMELFSQHTAGLLLSENESESATVADIRHAFEHTQNLTRRGGLGLASGPDGWWISYRSRMFETKDLLTAAENLHRAIRAAVDPEAFSDFRGNSPYIELRDPAHIVRPWRPGSELVARQAAVMAEIERNATGMQQQSAATAPDETDRIRPASPE